MNHKFLKELEKNIPQSCIKTMEDMSGHTTFRVGGTAHYFVSPESATQIKEVLSLCNQYQIPYFVMGKGSNLLVADTGFEGLILSCGKGFDEISCQDTVITAQAGASLAKIAKVALERELTGFEFAAGIPGTLGGAISMNAGAYGGEMKQVVESVSVLTKQQEILTLTKDMLGFGYRTSEILVKDYIVLSANIRLSKGNQAEIQDKMNELATLRKEKQPLEYPSAGSTFKRPEGHFAGKLIQDAGLAGYSIGGAQVSSKHCGFVINKEAATANDIYDLIKHVKEEVKRKFQVELEPEVKFLGEFH